MMCAARNIRRSFDISDALWGPPGMAGPRVKGKRMSAVQLRAAPVRPLQSGSLLAVRLKAADVTAAVRFRGRI